MHMRLSRRGAPRVPVRSGTSAVTHPPAGPLPPARASEGHGSVVSRERLVEPPGSHIRVSDETLLRRVQGLVASGDAERLGTLQQLLLDLSSLEQARQGRVLQERFGQLAGDPSLGQAKLMSKQAVGGEKGGGSGAEEAGPAGPQQAQQVVPEGEGGVQLAFLRQLCAAMTAAGYRPLTADEWAAALCENFLFTLPVTADYSSMDPGLVPPAWQRHLAAAAAAPPQLAGRAVMWHRGAQAARASTPAWALKIDLLLSFWLLQPLWSGLAWLLALFGLRLPGAPGVGTRPYADPHEPSPRASAEPAVKPGAEGGPAGPPGCVIERRTFARAFPNGRAVWRQLTRPVQLQEACFSDVVLLYRPAAARGTATGGAAGVGGSQHAQQAAAGAGEHPSVEESVGGASDEAHLVLKQYRRIPLADLEMVLPGAAVYLPPNLYLSLAFTLFTGLAAVVAAMWRGKFSAGLLQTVATILLTRAYQMYMYVTNERTAIVKHMTQMLYERTAASQAGVLHTLTAELATQRARQLLVCYCALLEAGRTGLPESEVSARCHALLAGRAGQRDVQFDAAVPLHQLKQWGVVQPATPGGDSGAGGGTGGDWADSAVAAVPVGQAVERLRRVLGGLAAGDEEEEEIVMPEAAGMRETAGMGEAGGVGEAGKPVIGMGEAEEAGVPAAGAAAGQAGAAGAVEAASGEQGGSAAAAPASRPTAAAAATEGGLGGPLPPTPAPAAAPEEEGPVGELPPPPSSPQAAPLAHSEEEEETHLLADSLLLPPTPTAASGLPPVRQTGTGEAGGHPSVTVERLGGASEGKGHPGSPSGGARSRLSRLLRPGSG